MPGTPAIAVSSQPAFLEGMQHHNAHEFYEAHESWEELWIDEGDDDVRRFLQGLIQVTSAFHKLVHQRMPGSASRLLVRGLSKLEGFPDDHQGVDLGRFRAGALELVPVLAAIEKTEQSEAFDRARIPLLHLLHPEHPERPVREEA